VIPAGETDGQSAMEWSLPSFLFFPTADMDSGKKSLTVLYFPHFINNAGTGSMTFRVFRFFFLLFSPDLRTKEIRCRDTMEQVVVDFSLLFLPFLPSAKLLPPRASWLSSISLFLPFMK